MSQENVDRALQAVDAFNRRDLDSVLALVDREVEFMVVAPDGPYYGHDGVRKWWRDLLDTIPDFRVEVVEIRDLGDWILGVARIRGHGGDSDVPFDETNWQIGEWRHGKCRRWRTCRSEAEALEAAGLSE
jgi:ketosteroid isomerase-like protein